MPFQFQKLEIPGVILIKPRVFQDGRGYFLETYKQTPFVEAGIEASFIQDNISLSSRGVLRGLHYQLPPQAQGKMIYVVKGEIYDVVVDIRRGSPTYGKWIGKKLSIDNRQMLYVPEGFAHGFQALREGTQVVYKVTAEYAPDLDRGIAWDDPDLDISWPLQDPILSKKDARLPKLADAENSFKFTEGEL